MSWNPSVKPAPIVGHASAKAVPDEEREKKIAGAAAAGAAMAFRDIERRASYEANARTDGHASAWVIQGRIQMMQRWPH